MNPAQLRDQMLSRVGLTPWRKGEPRDVIDEGCRGRIVPIADGEFRSVMLIESKAGAVRANHWHKTDSHVMHIISGKARYVEVADGAIVNEVMAVPGTSILTEPLIPHAMEFLEDTVMVVCARNERDTETYLNDIVKVKIL